MRLDFNVLWVDDQPERVAAQIRRIAVDMEEQGFNFQPTQCRSMDEVRQLISTDVFTDEVDLVLVDWDLGGEVQGQDAIAEIRDRIQYKDVVFYSAQTAPDQLRQLAYNAGLEGIYCAARDGLVDEVVGVFDSLVKKVLDLDHTRGIVMGATSDIDHMVHQCLLAIHGKRDQPAQKAMLDEARGHIQRRIGELTETAKQLEAAATLAAFFEQHMILTANDRLRMLSGALKDAAFQAHNGFRGAVVSYMQDVVPKRNIYGHLVLVPGGKPTAIADIEGKEIGLEDARALRRLILGLRGDFRNLLSALQA